MQDPYSHHITGDETTIAAQKLVQFVQNEVVPDIAAKCRAFWGETRDSLVKDRACKEMEEWLEQLLREVNQIPTNQGGNFGPFEKIITQHVQDEDGKRRRVNFKATLQIEVEAQGSQNVATVTTSIRSDRTRPFKKLTGQMIAPGQDLVKDGEVQSIMNKLGGAAKGYINSKMPGFLREEKQTEYSPEVREQINQEMERNTTSEYAVPKFALKNHHKRVILCINGGGVRGIIPAMILMEFEKRLKSKMCNHVDIYAGTSVGSILTSMLLMGKSAKEFVHLLTSGLAHQILGGQTPAVKTQNLNNVLQEHLKDTNLYTIDLNKKRFLSPVFQIRPQSGHMQTKLFDSHRGDCQGTMLRDVVRRSASAPYYLQPETGNDFDGQQIQHADGGVCDNNPTQLVLQRLIDEEIELEDVVLINIGTGVTTKVVRSQSDCQGRNQDYSAQEFARSKLGKRFFGFHPVMERDIALDDVSDDAMIHMSQVAQDFVKNNSSEIDRALDCIQGYFDY